MFISDFSAPRQLQPALSDFETTRRGNSPTANWEAANDAPVGLSAGGFVLVSIATVVGACIGVLPVEFDFSWAATAGCWAVAAVYLLTAAHWLRAMLHNDAPAAARKP